MDMHCLFRVNKQATCNSMVNFVLILTLTQHYLAKLIDCTHFLLVALMDEEIFVDEDHDYVYVYYEHSRVK